MPANITKKCQQAIDFINAHREDGIYRERNFTHNTQVAINSDGSFHIRLWNTKIVEYVANRNEYIIQNGGWWSRTTSHDIRAYLELLLGYSFKDWNIFTDNWLKIEAEDYTIGYGGGRRRKFNPTSLVCNFMD